MNDLKRKIIIGSFCHDIGKVLYRDSSVANHSDMGYDFFKNDLKVCDKDILEQIRYHHSDKIRTANLEDNSLAFITYIADNIASMSDRRDEIKENKKDEGIYDRYLRLKSIFNKINNNDDDDKVYELGTFDDLNVFIPIEEKNVNHNIDDSFYSSLISNLKNGFINIFDDNHNIIEEYINSLLEVFESNLSFVPSSTNKNQVSDVSLFDHSKLTCCYASLIYDYLIDKNIDNYKECLYKNANLFYDEKVFLLLNLDLSGIQDFIYKHSNESSGMLKSLRTRSFYLDILLEDIVDEILEKLELSRANVLYIGGGHAYLLLSNIDYSKKIINDIINNINKWFIEEYNISLFLAYALSECSANDLNGENEDRYSEVFRESQIKISNSKMHKFDYETLVMLNKNEKYSEGRECAICKKTSSLIQDENGRYVCKTCKAIENISFEILNNNFFCVVDKNEEYEFKSLPLPFNKSLILLNQNEVKEKLINSKIYRVYCKNEYYTGKGVAKRINFADYYSRDLIDFNDMANASFGGYKKLAVFRADVDNLGWTFVNGFKHDKYKTKLMTISRNATFSRMMSLFFKKYINNILNNPDEYYVVDKEERMNFLNDKKRKKIKGRDIAIIYSGGDDIFAVGAWDEIINFSIDLNDKFKEFSQGTLTFSCGIGQFNASTPVSLMARLTGELEDVSKSYDNSSKEAITLFDSPIDDEYSNTYHFDEFITEVLCNKYETVKSYLINNEDRGRSFLYKLMELVKNSDDKINVARFAYMLARAKPNVDDSKNDNYKEEDYKKFSMDLIKWISNSKDKKELLTAIRLYAYYSRKEDNING